MLYAPVMSVTGTVSAVGGAGGDFTSPSTCVAGLQRSTGGAGGLGRIRISVDITTAGSCALGGSFNPPVAGCSLSSTPCTSYLAEYPN